MLFVSDLRLYRESVAEFLARHGEVNVLGSASCEGQLNRIREACPEVILLDVATGDGPRRIRTIAETVPETKIIAVGLSEATNEVVASAEAGAVGYISASASRESVVEAVNSAARGEAVFPPLAVAVLLRRVRTVQRKYQSFNPDVSLTNRELEVLEQLARRLSNKEIAQQLSIEVTTVKNHVHSILQKLGVHARSQAAAWLRDHETSGTEEARPFRSGPDRLSRDRDLDHEVDTI